MTHEDINTKIGTISLKELCSEKYNFIIPTYQRGYRWRTKHVEALIRDLYEFSEGQYCLQPIVLQKTDKNTFRVVDGQQRLTTLMLLLCAWDIKNVWTMDYEKKEDKQGVLNTVCRSNTSYIAENTPKNERDSIKDKMEKIFFIWYLLDEKEDGHAAFQRLNSGKIPLTASELIRAKLVGPKCANPYELAAEWERIEQRLRDDRFWFMFNGKASESFTRIDKLFEIITHTEEKVKLDRLAPYYAIEEKKDELWWEKLLNLFWMLEQCYNDVEVYHYIGWLRHFSGAQFSSLYALYEHDKINFKQNLQKIIINKDCDLQKEQKTNIAGLNIVPSNQESLVAHIEKNFLYGNDKLKAFFVLFNIESLNAKVRGKDKTARERNEYERFPFDLFSRNSWDIEHIASHTDNPMENPAEQVEWAIETYFENAEHKDSAEMCSALVAWLKSMNEPKYNEAKEQILKKLEKSQTDICSKASENGQILDFNKLYGEYKGENCISNDDKDKVWNLTLLDSYTNRSYHNAIFPVKRRRIIETDKNCAENIFIPPCTRNVFTKYYTQMAVSITQWTQQDSEDYRMAIADALAGLVNAAGYGIKDKTENENE